MEKTLHRLRRWTAKGSTALTWLDLPMTDRQRVLVLLGRLIEGGLQVPPEEEGVTRDPTSEEDFRLAAERLPAAGMG